MRSQFLGSQNFFGGLQFVVIHFKIHFKIIHFINLILYKEAYLVGPYLVILTVP